jgi:hypothetical protein
LWADGRRDAFGTHTVAERLYRDMRWRDTATDGSCVDRLSVFERDSYSGKVGDLSQTGGIFNLEFNTDG